VQIEGSTNVLATFQTVMKIITTGYDQLARVPVRPSTIVTEHFQGLNTLYALYMLHCFVYYFEMRALLIGREIPPAKALLKLVHFVVCWYVLVCCICMYVGMQVLVLRCMLLCSIMLFSATMFYAVTLCFLSYPLLIGREYSPARALSRLYTVLCGLLFAWRSFVK
jgi:hypothetical protein